MIDGGEHLAPVGYVGDEGGCLRADFGDLVGDGVDPVGGDVDERDVGAEAGQFERDAAIPRPAPVTSATRSSSGAADLVTGSTRTFILVPACSASKPSSMTSSIAIDVTQPVVSYIPRAIRSMTAAKSGAV